MQSVSRPDSNIKDLGLRVGKRRKRDTDRTGSYTKIQIKSERIREYVRVGLGPSTGNMDNSVPKTKNVIAVQATGTENLSPV